VSGPPRPSLLVFFASLRDVLGSGPNKGVFRQGRNVSNNWLASDGAGADWGARGGRSRYEIFRGGDALLGGVRRGLSRETPGEAIQKKGSRVYVLCALRSYPMRTYPNGVG